MENDIKQKQANAFIASSENWFLPMRKKVQAFCYASHLDYSDDVYSDTLLKCYQAILRNGILDTTEEGFKNYFFKSFVANVKREKQYAREKKRIYADSVDELYQSFLENNSLPEAEKVYEDTFKDFTVLYLLQRGSEHFSPDTFKLFVLKNLCSYTYQELYKKFPTARRIRQRVAEVKDWMIDNIPLDEVHSSFQKFLREHYNQ